jgi:hypothetical protein
MLAMASDLESLGVNIYLCHGNAYNKSHRWDRQHVSLGDFHEINGWAQSC